jgi:hypothetical protein
VYATWRRRFRVSGRAAHGCGRRRGGEVRHLFASLCAWSRSAVALFLRFLLLFLSLLVLSCIDFAGYCLLLLFGQVGALHVHCPTTLDFVAPFGCLSPSHIVSPFVLVGWSGFGRSRHRSVWTLEVQDIEHLQNICFLASLLHAPLVLTLTFCVVISGFIQLVAICVACFTTNGNDEGEVSSLLL